MSDLLSAAAAALGAPEPIVQRSAEARAKASGSTTEDVLAAWAGGQAAPAATPAPAEAGPEDGPAEPPAEPEAPEPAPEPQPVATTPAPAAPRPGHAAPSPAGGVAVAAGPVTPPILEGRAEHPFAVMVGAVGLLLLTMLIGFVAPAIPEEPELVYTSTVSYSRLAREGRQVYLSEGCAACHTQQVRPVVADAGLGGVTLSDTNQVIGGRRYGPDLAHAGARLADGDAELLAILSGAEGHPSYQHLSQAQLQALSSYVIESR